MYLKDKAQRITLRLNERQFNFVKGNADVLDVSPSEFLRMVINQTMILSNFESEGSGRGNDKADINDII